MARRYACANSVLKLNLLPVQLQHRVIAEELSWILSPATCKNKRCQVTVSTRPVWVMAAVAVAEGGFRDAEEEDAK